MTDPLGLSFGLGRWFGVQVRIHLLLVLFLAFRLLGAATDAGRPVRETACWLGLLLLALAIHEAGHAAMAWWLGAEPDDVRLWPLGSLVGPFQVARSPEGFWVALAGPLVNLAVALAAAVMLNLLANAQFIFSPFGNGHGSGAPLLIGQKLADGAPVFAAPFSAAWVVGWFGWLNWVLFVANLIPALPFDVGRALRAAMAGPAYAPAKDAIVAPYTARTAAVLLAVAGLLRMLWGHWGDGLTLVGLAVLIEIFVRTEAQALEEGGYYDDSVFGYDFSEGYTSLEGGTAKVRPYRESALKRWRRRRSELRRQRRQAREAAQERRLDEILQKLHQLGPSALSDEENRFLDRVSRQLRNRPKPGAP